MEQDRTQPPGTFPFTTTMSVALFGAAIDNPSVVRDILRVAGHDTITDHARAGREAILSPAIDDYADLLFHTCVDSEDLSAEEILEHAYAEAARALEADDLELPQLVGQLIYNVIQNHLIAQRIAMES